MTIEDNFEKWSKSKKLNLTKDVNGEYVDDLTKAYYKLWTSEKNQRFLKAVEILIKNPTGVIFTSNPNSPYPKGHAVTPYIGNRKGVDSYYPDYFKDETMFSFEVTGVRTVQMVHFLPMSKWEKKIRFFANKYNGLWHIDMERMERNESWRA